MNMKKYLAGISLIILLTVILFSQGIKSDAEKVDHSDMVTGPFAAPQDVTKACLGCHEEQAADVLKSRHWLWLGDEFEIKGKGLVKVGKKNSFNNSYININSNEQTCTSCHPGFGWKDSTFDFKNPENIDCLICHDNSGTYKRSPDGVTLTGAELEKAAQSVGRPTKSNCGNCHFESGGGASVNHGGLELALLDDSKKLDVHMNVKGFNCTNCHKSEKHQIKGAGHSSMAAGINKIACTDCHDNDKKEIHKNKVLGKHLSAIACESCHIPDIARENYTLTGWDWSTAGLKDDIKLDENHLSYAKNRGDLTWEKNVKPVFRWHNGKADYYMLGDKIDSKPLYINKLNGSISDAGSRISPFKIMKGKQIFDLENNYLIVPKLFGDSGFGSNFDWNKASESGMKSVNLAYSGKYDFVETIMLQPINHFVTPKEQAAKCTKCHGKSGMLDWTELGYPGDPMKKGSRVKNKLIKE